jgi:tetratricopeptide (TPR) repeat protein
MRHAMILWAALLAALLIAGHGGSAARADQDDPRLDGLFDRLRSVAAGAEAAAIQGEIWAIWIASEDREAARLMRQGIGAMAMHELDAALVAFDHLVEQAPEFAEGWNKRATVHYLMGNFDDSVRDIQKTLALEPRHFGALSGLGMIYDALEESESALRSYEAALEINPHLGGPRQRIEELRGALRGRRV